MCVNAIAIIHQLEAQLAEEKTKREGAEKSLGIYATGLGEACIRLDELAKAIRTIQEEALEISKPTPEAMLPKYHAQNILDLIYKVNIQPGDLVD